MEKRRQEPGVRSQESGVRSQEAGGRRQETGARSQESGGRRQKPGVRRSNICILLLVLRQRRRFQSSLRRLPGGTGEEIISVPG
jgi:hypothetical protein